MYSRSPVSVLMLRTMVYKCTHMYSTAQMQSITNARYERVCAFTKTRLRVRGNAFARLKERICAFTKTRLRVQQNAFERSKRTRSHDVISGRAQRDMRPPNC